MSDTPLSAYPLHDITDKQLQQLGKTLWQWQLCGQCEGRASCCSATCPWSRSKRLSKYWIWYKETVGAYVPEFVTKEPALRTHEDFLGIIRTIKTNPDTLRGQLTYQYFTNRTRPGTSSSDQVVPAATDQNRAFNIAAQILFMVNCTPLQEALDFVEHSYVPFSWRSEASATRFFTEAFSTSEHPYFDKDGFSKGVDVRSMLAAKHLKKAGLHFEATNDLRAHLSLDRKQGIVRVFHRTAILKENLRAYQQGDESISSNFVTKCNIPQELALEVLDTIHKVLFPPDRESQALLSLLVSRHSFDEDFLRYESAQFRAVETESSYPYFGAQLAALYDEIQNPTPRGWLQTWLERNSGARYVMMATVVGVFIAVVLGILGLGVSSFQAWVSYQQWKHPVRDQN